MTRSQENTILLIAIGMMIAGLLIGLIGAGSYGGYRGIRYLAGVVRRARGMG